MNEKGEIIADYGCLPEVDVRTVTVGCEQFIPTANGFPNHQGIIWFICPSGEYRFEAVPVSNKTEADRNHQHRQNRKIIYFPNYAYPY